MFINHKTYSLIVLIESTNENKAQSTSSKSRKAKSNAFISKKGGANSEVYKSLGVLVIKIDIPKVLGDA